MKIKYHWQPQHESGSALIGTLIVLGLALATLIFIVEFLPRIIPVFFLSV